MNKPHSQSCDNNKQPILEKLKPLLTPYQNVVEIGSGTGQHAIHFANALPNLTWQTTDLPINHSGIKQWINDSGLSNINPPLCLDLSKPWPISQCDVIYTANTLHIVSTELVTAFFAAIKHTVSNNGLVIIYGPFNYAGEFTSDSNRQFESWLKGRDSNSGIRDIEWITELAAKANLHLLHDEQMPANNRLLTFKKLIN